MTAKNSFFKNYGLTLILLLSILVGSLLGIILNEKAACLKPFGDIFLNLLFSIVVPLVFFSISSAVANMGDGRRLGKILLWMMIVFTVTGAMAALFMIFVVKAFLPPESIHIALSTAPAGGQALTWQEQLVGTFTVSDFASLFLKKNMMALIIFSLLVGLAVVSLGAKAKAFRDFLISGNEVFTKLVSFIMYYAPVGLAAYFAYLTGVFGPQLLGAYAHAVCVYYPASLFYFFVFFSLYAYCAGGAQGCKIFWLKVIPLSFSALATGSSVACIPINLQTAKNIGIPEDIREVVIPIGASIHMDGSCLSAILKIAVLFSIFHLDFSGTGAIATAVGIALLSGTVMSGIPGGGFLGELMIITMYGFPMEALPIISMIGILVDPPATMVNSVGDNVSSMLVSRFINGKKWLTQHAHV